MPNTDKKIQDLLRSLLNETGMTERELADSVNVSQSYLNKMKNGNLNLKPIRTILSLLEKYQVGVTSHLPAPEKDSVLLELEIKVKLPS